MAAFTVEMVCRNGYGPSIDPAAPFIASNKCAYLSPKNQIDATCTDIEPRGQLLCCCLPISATGYGNATAAVAAVFCPTTKDDCSAASQYDTPFSRHYFDTATKVCMAPSAPTPGPTGGGVVRGGAQATSSEDIFADGNEGVLAVVAVLVAAVSLAALVAAGVVVGVIIAKKVRSADSRSFASIDGAKESVERSDAQYRNRVATGSAGHSGEGIAMSKVSNPILTMGSAEHRSEGITMSKLTSKFSTHV